jgi:hypothetical protein
MPLKKVSIKYISNGSTHRGTYQKCIHGMMKKASELTTLCDAKACVIYVEGESVPQVYPSHNKEVAILKLLKDMSKQKNTMDQECFYLQCISRL